MAFFNPHLPESTRNALVDVMTAPYADQGGTGHGGYLRIYSGTQPADTTAPITGSVLLIEFQFVASPFPPASGGQAFADTSTLTGTATGTGEATFYRAVESDGTTVIMDGSVGVFGGDLNLSQTAISTGDEVIITTFAFQTFA